MIEVQSVSRRFDDLTAVEDVTLTVGQGEMVALVGTSGSGKTTLLRMINRLVEPTSGRILLNGVDTGTLKPHLLRRRIGYAIQGHGLFPHYTVAQNIAVVPELLRWPKDRIRERVDALLALFQMPPVEFRDRYPAALSGGQQQRVGVARALAAEPEVLLMDEPFGALDPVTRARAQADLRAVQARLGTTTVVVTHDMEEAIALGDRIAVLDRGRLVQYAAPAQILTAPANDFVGQLIGQSERPFRLLALSRVSDHLEPGAAPGTPIDAESSARDALAECLWSGRDALPVVRDGKPVGRVTMAALAAHAGGPG